MVSPSPAVALAILPRGLVVPPPTYLVGLLVASVAVGGWLERRRPTVTGPVIVAFAPWMAAGAAAHVLSQLGAAPPVLAPLFGAPAVYVTTFACAGAVWGAISSVESGSTVLGIGATGTVLAVVASGLVLRAGAAAGTLAPRVPAIALALTVVVTVVVYRLYAMRWPTLAERTASLGGLVIFSHTLDGVSTALGVDLLDSGERSPLPRLIMDVAAELPTADVLGTGWLFVLVKLGVAVGVLVLFAEFLEEEPTRARILLGVVAAVGLGPGVNNLLLFAALG